VLLAFAAVAAADKPMRKLGHPMLSFPMQNVKEQAPERFAYSTLTQLDGNAAQIIHISFATLLFKHPMNQGNFRPWRNSANN
jgi:hypothetical protein